MNIFYTIRRIIQKKVAAIRSKPAFRLVTGRFLRISG